MNKQILKRDLIVQYERLEKDLEIERSVNSLLRIEAKEEAKRCLFWETTAKRRGDSEEYYRIQLAEAHALLGRVVHQTSERWDTVRLTQNYPTDNLHGSRTANNPTGKKNFTGIRDEI